MPIPDCQSLMLSVLRRSAGGLRRVPEMARDIAAEFGLSQAEQDEMLPSGRQSVLHNRIHWTKFYMSKAGLIDSPQRGIFTASPVGLAFLARHPLRLDTAVLKEFPEFHAFYAGERNHAPEGMAQAESQGKGLTPEERIDEAAAALDNALRADLVDRITREPPAFFEALIVDLLVAMGYGGSHADAARRLGRSGDGGIDGVISEDRLGLDRIYVQAKRYAPGNAVGRPEVQSFVGSLVGMGATKGVFVTVSTFSQLARDYAKHLSQHVILIDGFELASLMIEYGVGVRTFRTVEVKRVDEDFFSPEDGRLLRARLQQV